MVSVRRIISFLVRPQLLHRFKHLCRYHVMRRIEPNGRYMLIDVKGHKMIVKRNPGMRYPSVVWINGYYEKNTTKYLEKYLKPGDTVIDIGANAGYYTLLMAKLVGPTGKVIAFEPDREMYALLMLNIAFNGYGNVVAFNKAVSCFDGYSEFFVNEVGGYSSLIHRDGTLNSVTVETAKVDSLGLDEISFVKIDVECAEFNVLDGMRETIRKNPNMQILMEYAPIECGVKAVQFATALPEFRLSFIDENGILAKKK